MTTLTLELQPELYDRLCEEAARLGETVEKTAEIILTEYLIARSEMRGPKNDRFTTADGINKLFG